MAEELAALERRGIPLWVASLRQPYDRVHHPVHAAVRAEVHYLPEYLHQAPGRVLRSHLRVLARAPGRYLRTAGGWLRDFRRDPTRNRLRRLGQAGVLAAELPPDVRHLHAHFLHTPASVTRYAAALTGLPFSLSGHAKDVWTTPAWDLREKLLAARVTVACTEAARQRLSALAPTAPVRLVYHGLDRRRFGPPGTAASGRDGGDPRDPVRLLAVGRFHPTKGYDVLLDALVLVQAHVRLTIVGYGPLEPALRRQAQTLGLGERVAFTGPLDQPAVLALYRASDLFTLAPRVAADGDRDGLPNVVVEALSQGLPVVATRVAALPELVTDGVEGRLVPPDDPPALAAALEALARDPEARRRHRQAALARLAQGFDVDGAAAELLAHLGLSPGGVTEHPETVPASRAHAAP